MLLGHNGLGYRSNLKPFGIRYPACNWLACNAFITRFTYCVMSASSARKTTIFFDDSSPVPRATSILDVCEFKNWDRSQVYQITTMRSVLDSLFEREDEEPIERTEFTDIDQCPFSEHPNVDNFFLDLLLLGTLYRKALKDTTICFWKDARAAYFFAPPDHTALPWNERASEVYRRFDSAREAEKMGTVLIAQDVFNACAKILGANLWDDVFSPPSSIDELLASLLISTNDIVTLLEPAQISDLPAFDPSVIPDSRVHPASGFFGPAPAPGTPYHRDRSFATQRLPVIDLLVAFHRLEDRKTGLRKVLQTYVAAIAEHRASFAPKALRNKRAILNEKLRKVDDDLCATLSRSPGSSPPKQRRTRCRSRSTTPTRRRSRCRLVQ